MILDTTFKTNTENYKVLVFCYPSVVNSRTAVGAVAIVSEENDENLRKCFELYKQHASEVVMRKKNKGIVINRNRIES